MTSDGDTAVGFDGVDDMVPRGRLTVDQHLDTRRPERSSCGSAPTGRSVDRCSTRKVGRSTGSTCISTARSCTQRRGATRRDGASTWSRSLRRPILPGTRHHVAVTPRRRDGSHLDAVSRRGRRCVRNRRPTPTLGRPHRRRRHRCAQQRHPVPRRHGAGWRLPLRRHDRRGGPVQLCRPGRPHRQPPRSGRMV